MGTAAAVHRSGQAAGVKVLAVPGTTGVPLPLRNPALRGRRKSGVAGSACAARGSNSAGAMIQAMERTLLAAFPFGCKGTVDEVARVVLFCAGDPAAFMTGSCVLVDGGTASKWGLRAS